MNVHWLFSLPSELYLGLICEWVDDVADIAKLDSAICNKHDRVLFLERLTVNQMVFTSTPKQLNNTEANQREDAEYNSIRIATAGALVWFVERKLKFKRLSVNF